jgi:hypothetical protein
MMGLEKRRTIKRKHGEKKSNSLIHKANGICVY